MGLREAQVLTQMKQFFDVKPQEGEVEQLPENTRVVMVVHPQNLSEKTQYTLDQWAVNGGATLIFVDPYAENQIGPRGMPPPDASSDLPKLFKAWASPTTSRRPSPIRPMRCRPSARSTAGRHRC